MLKHKLLVGKWYWWILAILPSILIYFYCTTLRQLLISPTLLPSGNTAPPTTLDTEFIPSAHLGRISITTFDLGLSTFIGSLGEIVSYPIQGTLGVPADRDGSFPIVFIFPGYNENLLLETDRLDMGFTYLVQELAVNGYLTISLNIPPNYLLGHDSSQNNDRIRELFNSHLHVLSRALTGEDVGYGIDITGLGDLSSTSFISHSLNAESLYNLIDLYSTSDELNLSSLLFIAPSYPLGTKVSFANVPTGIILPELDGAIVSLDGQALYDDLSRLESRHSLTSLVYLYGANHNAFNSLIEVDDSLNLSLDLSTKKRLSPHNQRDFIAKYSTDFLDSVLKNESLGIGLHASTPAPSQLYSYDVLTSLDSYTKLPIFAPAGEYSERFNALGGDIKLKNISLTYVVDSYIATKDTAGAFFLPGNPFEFPLLRLSWNVPSGEISTFIPSKYEDVTAFDALSLSIGLDPTNNLNLSDTPQSFIIEFKDSLGRSQRVLIDSSAPAMSYHSGTVITNPFTSYWSGFTPLSALRIPLDLLDDIDLTHLHSISLIFNQTSSGSLMVGNMSFIGDNE